MDTKEHWVQIIHLPSLPLTIWATFIRNQGKDSEAEKLYRRALDGYTKALGSDHVSALSIINNLGNLYKNQSKHSEVEKMYR